MILIRYHHLFLLLLVCSPLFIGCAAEEETKFTVVAYNVENFFDIDGVAMFDDYKVPDEPGAFTYSRHKLATKLNNAVAVLKTLDSGAGPDVILFQEFENDFTPESSVEDFDAFLSAHIETTVNEMLLEGWKEEFAGIPSVAWMVKAMADAGMSGYEVAVAPVKTFDSGIAHVNAIFSRFPIQQAISHPTPDARDILEAQLSVNGNAIWVYCNHWKSGASSPSREPIRVENAKTLRALVDARLAEDPQADIIIGGDLNSHYNHSILFPEIETGINDVLGSHGSEAFAENDLYNLWFELPVPERYSEVWRGRRGTLMHLLVSSGLYDGAGVSYVDQSFDKLVIKGLNADQLGRPRSWHFAGKTGGGVSDHFPVFAKFSTASFSPVADLSTGLDAPAEEIPLGFESENVRIGALPDGEYLAELTDDELAAKVDILHVVEAEVTSFRPLRLRVNQNDWAAYAPASRNVDQLRRIGLRKKTPMVVSPGFWRGERQLIVEGIVTR
ncbi:MAG: endonuclease/exonuclease/phosphatase family protein [Verrucomicrobiota bacterium]